MIIFNMLNNYEIRNKLRYIISNNISFNDTFIKYPINILYKKDVFYDAKQRRLRCNNYYERILHS